MYNIGINDDGSYKYFDYDIDTNLKKNINMDKYSNVDIVLIKELHSGLNYEKIQKVMHSLNWDYPNSIGQTTIEEIQDQSLDCIVEIFKNVKYKLQHNPDFFKDPENIPISIGSSGFTALSLGENAYQIYFSIADWDTYIYCEEKSDGEFLKNYCSEFYNAKKADERKIKIKNILDDETN